jgi:hypothetical protein
MIGYGAVHTVIEWTDSDVIYVNDVCSQLAEIKLFIERFIDVAASCFSL